MTTIKEQNELRDKIVAGLELAYARLLAFKKQKGTPLVVWREGKIVHLKPE